ncbi:hypothetical protein L7F22_026426 [Adiantum nelumboides]|nr:hypothetical protein [Adiantum nelumboides]
MVYTFEQSSLPFSMYTYSLFVFIRAMDSQIPPLESQPDEEFVVFEPMFTPSPYCQFSSSSPVLMAYAMPSHGFSAMLTSSCPSAPILFGPTPICGMPNVASLGEHASKSPITGKLLFEESTHVKSTKPRKNAWSQNQSVKEGTDGGDGTALK